MSCEGDKKIAIRECGNELGIAVSWCVCCIIVTFGRDSNSNSLGCPCRSRVFSYERCKDGSLSY